MIAPRPAEITAPPSAFPRNRRAPILAAASVILAAALAALQALRIAAGAVAPREFMIAGDLLGASCWVKAVLFPLSLVWLAGLLWLLFRRRAPNALRCAACLLGAWLLPAAPLAAAGAR